MPLDFCENNWKSTCACRLTENKHKKKQKVQKEKDEIGENREYLHTLSTNETVGGKSGKRIGGEQIGPKITEKMENNGKLASLINTKNRKRRRKEKAFAEIFQCGVFKSK